jgi:hypothetical protein
MTPTEELVNVVSELGPTELRNVLRVCLQKLYEGQTSRRPEVVLDRNKSILFTIYPAPSRVANITTTTPDQASYESFGYSAEEAAKLVEASKSLD